MIFINSKKIKTKSSSATIFLSKAMKKTFTSFNAKKELKNSLFKAKNSIKKHNLFLNGSKANQKFRRKPKTQFSLYLSLNTPHMKIQKKSDMTSIQSLSNSKIAGQRKSRKLSKQSRTI
jgi:hypothetical protein